MTAIAHQLPGVSKALVVSEAYLRRRLVSSLFLVCGLAFEGLKAPLFLFFNLIALDCYFPDRFCEFADSITFMIAQFLNPKTSTLASNILSNIQLQLQYSFGRFPQPAVRIKNFESGQPPLSSNYSC